MDVNLTISLIRGQMGVVIEKAVTVAVETVLGEMMKVVSIKFDEFRKEMHAKEKENENVRQMLEISRCQMRAMRKYLSVHATPKDDHHGQPTPRQQPQPPPQQQQLNQFESVRAPEVYPDQPAFIQPPQQAGLSNGPLSRRTVHSQTRTELRASSYPHVSREEYPSTAPQRPKDPTPELVAVEDSPLSEVRLIGSDGTTTLLTSVKQEAPAAVEVECSFEVEAAGESGDIITQGRRGDQASPAERALADQLQPQPRHLSSGEAAEEEPSPPLVSSTAPVVKEEVLDADAVPIKQEPQEVEVVVEGDLARSSSSGGGGGGGGAADAASQRYLEASRTLQITAAAAVPVGQSAAAYYPALASSSTAYAVSQSCLPMVTNVSTATAPIPASSSSLAEGSRRGQGQTQSHLQGQGQGQGRPWLRELGLYEQYKQARAELRRRSQLRRKQLEQDLPQALLADLVRERREKTRLRVARWRARRKLQAACLMGAAAAQQGNANTNVASSAAVVAAAAAAAQAGQSMQRVSGLHMQVQMQAAAGIAGQQQQQHHQQQQRLGGSRQLQQQQQQQARQQQGRVGMQYGSRLGGGYAFAAGAHQGLGPLGGEPGGSGGGSGGASGGLSAQAYGSAERFSQQQHRATFLQHSTQGADTDLFQ